VTISAAFVAYAAGFLHRCCFRSVAVVRECRAGSRRACDCCRVFDPFRESVLDSGAPRIVRAGLPDGFPFLVAQDRLPCGGVTFRACLIVRPIVCVRAFTCRRARGAGTGRPAGRSLTVTALRLLDPCLEDQGEDQGNASGIVRNVGFICPLTRCRSGWLLQEVATGSPPPDRRPPPPGPWRRPAQRRTRTRPAGSAAPCRPGARTRPDTIPGCRAACLACARHCRASAWSAAACGRAGHWPTSLLRKHSVSSLICFAHVVTAAVTVCLPGE
jgi:hypothetical protein